METGGTDNCVKWDEKVKKKKDSTVINTQKTKLYLRPTNRSVVGKGARNYPYEQSPVTAVSSTPINLKAQANGINNTGISKPPGKPIYCQTVSAKTRWIL
jgi:hypothetical protein